MQLPYLQQIFLSTHGAVQFRITSHWLAKSAQFSNTKT